MGKTLFVAIAIAGGLYAQTSTPVIQAPAIQLVTFGMIGLAGGQTARVNALGLPMGGPIIAGASCSVTVTFFDDTGKSLGASTQPVVGNQAIHFDLPRTVVDAETDRRQIRATVYTSFLINSVPPPGILGAGQCSVKPTLEIFNEDGRTMAILVDTMPLPVVVPLLAGN